MGASGSSIFIFAVLLLFDRGTRRHGDVPMSNFFSKKWAAVELCGDAKV
jgi:hypothetical protein